MSLRELLLTGEQIRAGRAILRIEQSALAKASGVSLETIKRLERMRGPVEEICTGDLSPDLLLRTGSR